MVTEINIMRVAILEGVLLHGMGMIPIIVGITVTTLILCFERNYDA